jgi:hypothetical protein
MALGYTQPLTEMSTRNLPGVNRRPAKAWSWQLHRHLWAAIWQESAGTSTSHNPPGTHSLLTGIATIILKKTYIGPRPTLYRSIPVHKISQTHGQTNSIVVREHLRISNPILWNEIYISVQSQAAKTWTTHKTFCRYLICFLTKKLLIPHYRVAMATRTATDAISFSKTNRQASV